MTRLELLEQIADKVQQLRDLERQLVKAKDPSRVMRSLKETRTEIDELLRERRAKD